MPASNETQTWEQPGGEPIVTITVGVDGRIYCHDLTRDLAPVLVALCPDDPVLATRMAAAQFVGEKR